MELLLIHDTGWAFLTVVDMEFSAVVYKFVSVFVNTHPINGNIEGRLILGDDSLEINPIIVVILARAREVDCPQLLYVYATRPAYIPGRFEDSDCDDLPLWIKNV